MALSLAERLAARTSKWRFVLVNSFDMSRVGELSKASGRKLSIFLNKPGSADFTYPMDADNAEIIAPFKTGIVAERFNWRATLARNLSGLPGDVWDAIWSGYVLPINEAITDNKMTVSCVGWRQRLDRRILRADYLADDLDDGVIIGDLIQRANGDPTGSAPFAWRAGVNSYVAPDGYTIRWPAGSSPNNPTWLQWGGVAPNEGVGGATAYVNALRDYKKDKYQPILPMINDLINLENGCDINVDPITRTVTAHRRYRRVRDDVIVALGWGPNNINQMERQIDADLQVNYVLAQGAAGTIAQYADNITSMNEIGPIEEVVQLGDVHNATVLLVYAGAEILVRSGGHVTYGVTPFPYTPNGVGVPEPFVDYREGDQIRVTAKQPPRVDIRNEAVRVFGFSVDIDENDNEKIGQLQLSP